MNASARKESLETRIGLYWLHKIGVASIVFGFAFLLVYSIQYFGPVLKLLTGFLASAALIATGEVMARKQLRKWFGYGLVAGGWALAFFTAYAAYFIPTVKVLDSLPAECALLMAVSGGSLWSALRANSELMGILSIALASASILISDPGLSGDVSFLIIAASTCILANRRSWNKLFGFGLVCCYVGHFSCCHQFTNLLGSSNAGNDLASIGFLSLIWLTFTTGIGYSFHDSSKARNIVTALVWVNASAFGLGLIVCNQNPTMLKEVLLASAGTAYLSIAKWLSRRDQKQLSTVHSLLGLILINGAKAMRFSGLELITFDVMEISILAVIGLRHNIRIFRWFAVLLSCILVPLLAIHASMYSGPIYFGFHVYSCAKSGIVAATVLAVISFLYRQDREWLPSDPDVKLNYGQFYYLCSNALAAFTITQIVDPCYQVLALATLATINHAFALKLGDDLQYAVGFLSVACALVLALISKPVWLVLPMTLTTAVLYAGYGCSVLFRREGQIDHSISLKWLYGYSANILLTLLLFDKVPFQYLSLAFGAEGLCLIAAGCVLAESSFRLCGLSVLGILTLKLLFLDLSDHNTFERIISFIGAGFVFLISSFAYAKFTRAFEEENEPDTASSALSDVPNCQESVASQIPLSKPDIQAAKLM